jgi:NADH-quinone oxidoreductase subunit N
MTFVQALLPSFLLTAGVLAVVFADLLGKGRRPWAPAGVAIAALAAAALAGLVPLARGQASHEVFLGAFRADAFALVFTVFCAVTGIVSILAAFRGDGDRTPSGEFLALVVSSVLGMTVLSGSVDVVTLYLAFETVSITGYVLVGMRRSDRVANEASMKYVLFGALSSGLMLYGLSLLFGLAGGTSLESLRAAVAHGAASQPAFVAAAVLVFAGFAFKISAVPFHFWAPDVYQGAPAAVAGFLSVASKAAGFAALVRVAGAMGVDVAQGDPARSVLPWSGAVPAILSVSAVLTMTVGNMAALRQTEIKRLLAWSSIAHAGYMLMGVAVWTQSGIESLVFYLLTYLFMNLAAFLLAGILIRETGSGDLANLRGLGFRNPWLAGALTIVMLGLTGVPPMLGFLGKYVLFQAVLERGYVWFAVIGLVNGAVSLYYYAKPLFRMYLQDVEGADAAPARAVRLEPMDVVLACVLVLPVLAAFLQWGPLYEWVKGVAPALRYSS